MKREEIEVMFPGVVLCEPPEWADEWGWRTCNVDMTSSYDFRWPYPGGVAEVDGPANGEVCGVGLHLAKTVAAATSVGYRRTVQVVAYSNDDVLEEGTYKLRIRRAFVAGLADLHQLLKPGANLYEADLRGADLRGANLHGADLCGAVLYEANLRGADLYGANLRAASLYGANLHGADLRGADLYGADLYGANLYGADLYGAIGVKR